MRKGLHCKGQLYNTYVAGGHVHTKNHFFFGIKVLCQCQSGTERFSEHVGQIQISSEEIQTYILAPAQSTQRLSPVRR